MRLDRLDPYLSAFRSAVAEVRRGRPDADGAEDDEAADDEPTPANAGGVWLRLERSAFYPTSGGQPHDLGAIGPWSVSDVIEAGGVVWHRLADAPAGSDDDVAAGAAEAVATGDRLDCRVDWDRRFRHMQRHTAEHLLAQAFTRVGDGHHTRAVSMRGPDCTIDLTGNPDERAIAAAEEEANRAAREALPVMAFEVGHDRLGEYPLRRPTARTGMVRLVAIGDYDVVACGGTHLRSTAQALPIKVTAVERIKQGLTRITFRAGSEAHGSLAAGARTVRELTRLLSAPAAGLVERVERLLAESADLRRELAGERAAAARRLARAALAEAVSSGSGRLVSRVLAGEEAALFEPLIEELQGAAGTTSLLAAVQGGSVRLAFLTGPGVAADVRPALQAALAVVDGRGGGRPDRAQGAGDRPEAAEEALAAARLKLA